MCGCVSVNHSPATFHLPKGHAPSGPSYPETCTEMCFVCLFFIKVSESQSSCHNGVDFSCCLPQCLTQNIETQFAPSSRGLASSTHSRAETGNWEITMQVINRVITGTDDSRCVQGEEKQKKGN